MSQFNQEFNTSNNFQSEAFADCIANSKQIFQLINSILPLESCLRYQILPLELQGDRLTVGMLEPNDKNALNYICPIATSLGYHLDFKLIDSETHQLILSAYLKEPPTSNRNDRDRTIVDIQPNSDIKDYQKTIVDIQPDTKARDYSVDKSMTLTEMPDDFDFASHLAEQSKQEAIKNNVEKNVDKSMTLNEISSTSLPNKQSFDFHETPPLVVDNKNESELSIPKVDVNEQAENSRVVDVSAKPVTTSPDFLATLNPQLSYRELLTKALDNDIEKLQLVKYSDRGRIVGSKNGSVASCLERVELTIFNILINEIKTLAQIPKAPLTKSKKVAMERLYQQERILFRLEFIPQQYGEEVIVLILRGDSLMAYEQQQMDKMSEQVLVTAQKLEKMLEKMQICFTSARLNNLKDLQMLQQQIDRHLQLLDK